MPGRVRRERETRLHFALGIQRHQFIRQIINGFLRAGLCFRPLRAAHFVQRRHRSVRRDIFFQLLNALDRQKQPILARVFDPQIIAVRAVQRNRFQTRITTDTVHLVHHVIAFRQIREIANLVAVTNLSAPPLFLRAENIRGGEHNHFFLRPNKTGIDIFRNNRNHARRHFVRRENARLAQSRFQRRPFRFIRRRDNRRVALPQPFLHRLHKMRPLVAK